MNFRSNVTLVDELPPPVEILSSGEPLNSREEREFFEGFWVRFESLCFSEVQKLKNHVGFVGGFC